jgi:predicted RNase H-like nuclease (RuvC/YqgF family)
MAYKDDAVSYASLVVELKNELEEKDNLIRNLTNQIEIQKQMPVPLTVIKQVAEMKEQIQKLESDLKYFKTHVNESVIINRENKTRQSVRKNQFARNKKKD